jgi:Na+-translocating ferredoxin:NAD+ oxidoreductase RnfD subunit
MSDIVTTAPPTVIPKPKPAPKKLFGFIDDKYIAPVLITLILLAGQMSFGILESYWKTLLAIGTSILVELILGRLFLGKWPHLASAYISGISVGILIRSPEIWPYALTSALAITSKYVIRVHNRHIWNPSNFAICAMLIIAHEKVATLGVQWGNTIWPMLVVWALGSIIIMRLKRFHICLTYVLAFVAFAFLRSLIVMYYQPNPNQTLLNFFLMEVAPITGPMYQLFIFFMITDPKTTVRAKWGQVLVAFLIAAVECAIRLQGTLYGTSTFFAQHAPYYALTIVGPLAMLWEIWRDSRRPKAVAAPATA